IDQIEAGADQSAAARGRSGASAAAVECQSSWLGQPRGADSERLAGSHTPMHIDLQRLTNIKAAIAISDNLHKTAASERLAPPASQKEFFHVVTPRAETHSARAGAVKGVSSGLRQSWLRIRGAARQQGVYRPPSLAEVPGALRGAQVLERRRRRNRAAHAQ